MTSKQLVMNHLEHIRLQKSSLINLGVYSMSTQRSKEWSSRRPVFRTRWKPRRLPLDTKFRCNTVISSN